MSMVKQWPGWVCHSRQGPCRFKLLHSKSIATRLVCAFWADWEAGGPCPKNYCRALRIGASPISPSQPCSQRDPFPLLVATDLLFFSSSSPLSCGCLLFLLHHVFFENTRAVSTDSPHISQSWPSFNIIAAPVRLACPEPAPRLCCL